MAIRLVIVFELISPTAAAVFLERGILDERSPAANKRPQLLDPVLLFTLPVEFCDKLLFKAYALEKAYLYFRYY